MTAVVKEPATTRLSAKNQVTIPVAVLAETGLSPGERVRVIAAGPGRITLERVSSLEQFKGALSGVFEPGFLEKLRDEWR